MVVSFVHQAAWLGEGGFPLALQERKQDYWSTEKEQVKRAWASGPKHYSCISSSIALIQAYAGKRDWPPDLSSSPPAPTVTRLRLPSLQDFVESKISYKIKKVHWKATGSNRSHRNDGTNRDAVHLLRWPDYSLAAYFQMRSFAQTAFPVRRGFCETQEQAIAWYKVACGQLNYVQIRQLIPLWRNFPAMFISDLYFDGSEPTCILTHFQPGT